jgi:dCMP deaminase
VKIKQMFIIEMRKMLKVIFSNNNLTQFQSNLTQLLNFMKPVSVDIESLLDVYPVKVTLEYEGHYNENSMKILREGACLKDAFCGSCEVYAYYLDENGNLENCYMFKKPTSYEYNAYPDRINVEIEFGELYAGPNIDKECEEIEKLFEYVEMMRKLMKEDFDKNSKKEEDNMKLKGFFECDYRTSTDMKFRDWLSSAELVIFKTDLDNKQYTLELKSKTGFDFHTVSDTCLKSLTAYTYEVSDKHPVPVNCHKLSSIKSFACKSESCTYRITLNFYDELENGDVEKYCCTREFIDKLFPVSSSEGDCLNFQFIKRRDTDDSSDKNTKNEGEDNMKHFSDCVGECITCAAHGHCLAGIGDDDYVVANKAELIRRLKNDNLSEYNQNEIKRVLNKEYHYDAELGVSLNNETMVELNRNSLSPSSWVDVLEEMDISKIPTDSTTKPNRISKHEYYLKIAEAVSLRGTCLRRKFGAIIVKDDRIVSTGYVGAPRGRINCCDLGTCYRMEHNIPSGQRYELCRSTHAEMNAIIQASPEEMKYATLYLVGIENDGSYTNSDCCSMCKRVIINSGISTVIARQADGSFKKIHVIEWINNDDSLDIDHKGY